MPASISFNLINLGGIKFGTHASFSYSPAASHATQSQRGSSIELPLPFHDLSPTPEPISLLSWHTTLSDFAGRDLEIASLKEWAERPQRVSTKLIIAEGGSGKSRLAAEFGLLLRQRGWSAGFADLERNLTYQAAQIGSLLIIDYPEEHRGAVQEFLGSLAKSEYPNKIRVLLLSRRPMNYWRTIFHAARCDDIIDYKPLILQHIALPSLYIVFNSTVDAASERSKTIPLPLSENDFNEWAASSPENSLPLFVMATAVHAAFYPEDTIVRYSGREIITALVERELQRLQPLSASLGLPPDTISRVLTIATLTGGLDTQGLINIWSLPGFNHAGVADPTGALAASGILLNGKVDSPKPDMVAAIMAAECLRKADRTASQWIWYALNIESDAYAGCERLARITQDEKIVFHQKESIITELMVDAIQNNPRRCEKLVSYFSLSETPHSLSAMEEAVWRTFSQTPDLLVKASALNNLAFSLVNRRAYKEAMEILREAAQIHSQYPNIFGDAGNFEHGLNLMNIGRVYCECSEDKLAVEILKASVKCFEPYALRGDVRALASLSGVQDLLGRSLFEIGKKGDGLKTVIRATEIARSLSATSPDAHEGEYISRLITFGSIKFRMGNDRGASATFDLAETTARDLVKRQPGRHEDKLAALLGNQAGIAITNREYAKAAQLYAQAFDLFSVVSNFSEGRLVWEAGTTAVNFATAAFQSGDHNLIIEGSRCMLRMSRRALRVKKGKVVDLEKYAVFAVAKAMAGKWGVPFGREHFEEFSQEFKSIIDEMEHPDEIYETAITFGAYPLRGPYRDWRHPIYSERAH